MLRVVLSENYIHTTPNGVIPVIMKIAPIAKVRPESAVIFWAEFLIFCIKFFDKNMA